MDLTKRSGQKPMLRQIEWRVQNGPNTKRSRQKPMLRQIEWRVQNGPNKTFRSKANVKTNRMESTKWT